MITNLSQTLNLSEDFLSFMFSIYIILIGFTVTFLIVKKFKNNNTIKNIITRIYAWWAIITLVAIIFFVGQLFSTVLLGLIVFIGLREFIKHLNLSEKYKTTVYFAYLCIPIQLYFALSGNDHMFYIFIPVIMFFILPAIYIIKDEYKNFLHNNSSLLWATMLMVFGASHLTWIRTKQLPQDFTGGAESIILYIVFLTQFNDVLQFLWGKTLGKRKLSPQISPNKTFEGFLGGVLTTTLISYLIRDLTPFSTSHAIIMGLTIACLGVFGDLTLSSFKRDNNIKDMGTIIPGHGGILDRVDSLVFTIPLSIHLMVFWGYLS